MKVLRPVLVLFIFVSCGETVEREQLFGRYVWNDERMDTLEIRPDGTYEYWMSTSGQKLKNYGTWKFDSASNLVEFELENFPFIKSHAKGQSWFSKARLKNNEVQLMYAPGSDLYLKQVKAFGR